jgi:transcriptional regulator with XRE-family HTH domain
LQLAPEKIDVHVGSKLRFIRESNGMSQTQLASTVGLTFQQIQKYEQGKNRISASKLWQFSDVLGVSPNFFFDGLTDAPVGSNERINRKVAEAAAQLHQLEKPENRRHVLELIKLLRNTELAPTAMKAE